MGVLVGDIMKSVNNYFEVSYVDRTFTIDEDGVLSDSEWLHSGQWIAVTGSIFHNGVWRIIDSRLSALTLDNTDSVPLLPAETFDGRIWSLALPAGFVSGCKKIDAYAAKTPVGAVASESFGNYSHSYMKGATGGILTWNEAFRKTLDTYRHMFTEVNL